MFRELPVGKHAQLRVRDIDRGKGRRNIQSSVRCNTPDNRFRKRNRSFSVPGTVVGNIFHGFIIDEEARLFNRFLPVPTLGKQGKRGCSSGGGRVQESFRRPFCAPYGGRGPGGVMAFCLYQPPARGISRLGTSITISGMKVTRSSTMSIMM